MYDNDFVYRTMLHLEFRNILEYIKLNGNVIKRNQFNFESII